MTKQRRWPPSRDPHPFSFFSNDSVAHLSPVFFKKKLSCRARRGSPDPRARRGSPDPAAALTGGLPELAQVVALGDLRSGVVRGRETHAQRASLRWETFGQASCGVGRPTHSESSPDDVKCYTRLSAACPLDECYLRQCRLRFHALHIMPPVLASYFRRRRNSPISPQHSKIAPLGSGTCP